MLFNIIFKYKLRYILNTAINFSVDIVAKYEYYETNFQFDEAGSLAHIWLTDNNNKLWYFCNLHNIPIP